MSRPLTVLALAGPSACGKDTVADMLVTHCGFTKMAFADALYNEVADAFGLDVRQLQHRPTKEQPLAALSLRACLVDAFVGTLIVRTKEGANLDLAAPRSPRQILQWWGTEYRRRQSPSYWTSKISERIAYMSRERLSCRFVITDCRFPNEAHLVRNEMGGQIWQIKRAGLQAAGLHESDVDGHQFAPDAVLCNDHDIRHLQQLVLGQFWAYDAGLARVTVEIHP